VKSVLRQAALSASCFSLSWISAARASVKPSKSSGAIMPSVPSRSWLCAVEKSVMMTGFPSSCASRPATLRRGEAALILIGPEGDFSPEEIAFARANGFEEIPLGAQRLRTETAAVAAVVMVSVANG